MQPTWQWARAQKPIWAQLILKVPRVKGAVINQSDVQNAANVAMGKGAEANVGSVTLK